MGEIRQVWRGFDPVQVQVSLSVLQIENERLRERLSDATAELEFLRTTRAETAADDGELTRALVLAERAATDVREDARLDAEIIRRQAEAELESVRRDIDAAKHQLGVLHTTQVALRNGDASAVATRIALIIDGKGGVGGDSASAQRMLEFAELLERGPRGEPAAGDPVPRKVEVPARIKTQASPEVQSSEAMPARKGIAASQRPASSPERAVAPISVPAASVPATSAPPVSVPLIAATADAGVPAPATGKALATTAESMHKPPLATRRRRVIRKSIDESANLDETADA